MIAKMEAEKKITFKEMLSPKWYVEQTKGWMKESYALILIAIIGNAYISFGMGHPVTWVTVACPRRHHKHGYIQEGDVDSLKHSICRILSN